MGQLPGKGLQAPKRNGLDSGLGPAYPSDKTMASWESIPESQRPFQRRLMEVFAGFVEHADYQIGRVIDEIEQMGQKENTVIFFIWGDNGSGAEVRMAP